MTSRTRSRINTVIVTCHNCENLRADGSCRLRTFLPAKFYCESFTVAKELRE